MTSHTVSLLLAFAMVPSNGSDWSRVQQFPAGSRIVVTPIPASAQQQRSYSSTSLANWSRVRTIVPGTRISVGVAAPDEVDQYFLDATDDAITFLDLTNRDLPRAARRTVAHVAATQPALFTATRWTEVTDGPVRVNQDGVFVKKHRVAALEEIVKTIDRGDVGEVSRRARVSTPSRPPERMSPGEIGTAAGVAALAPLALLPCGERGTCNAALVWGLLLGAPVAIGVIAAHHRRHQWVNQTVYQAP
jgi:hypothetical protein